MNTVLVGLKIAKKVTHYDGTKPPVASWLSQLLRQNHQLNEKAIITTSCPTDHSVVTCKINQRGVWVMDPSQNAFAFWTWQQVDASKAEIAVLET